MMTATIMRRTKDSPGSLLDRDSLVLKRYPLERKSLGSNVMKNIIQRNYRKNSQFIGSLQMTMLVSACGGGGGEGNSFVDDVNVNTSTTTFLRSGDVRNVSNSGDIIIDATSFGLAWDVSKNNIVNYSISTGTYGERWDNATHALNSLDAAMGQLEYYTKLDTNYLGYFDSPKAAADAGSLINLSIDRYTFDPYAYAYNPSQFDYYEQGDIYFTATTQSALSNAYGGGIAFYALLHELGHSIGLKHSKDATLTNPSYYQSYLGQFDQSIYTVMSYNSSLNKYLYEFDPQSYMIFDVYVLQALYGANPTTNAGDDTWALSSKEVYQTIYDASGNDTLNLRQFEQGAQVVLGDASITGSNISAGYVTSFANGLNAMPTTIHWLVGDFENVSGSNYSDVIESNSLVNIINGAGGDDLVISSAAGNDTISLGAGNDTLHIYTHGQQVTVTDFSVGTDKYLVFDASVDYISEGDYTITQVGDDVVISASDGTKVLFENTDVPQRYFTGDFDNYSDEFVYYDKGKMTFELSITGFNYFDLILADVKSGTNDLKYAITYTNIETEDPRFVSNSYNDFDWIDAEFGSTAVRNGRETLVIQDIGLSDLDLTNNATYIGFYVANENYWVGEDFMLVALANNTFIV